MANGLKVAVRFQTAMLIPNGYLVFSDSQIMTVDKTQPSLVLPPAAPAPHTLIIGCGNLLRGDDAVGPILVRQLLEHDLPAQVRLADGGTAGMDVAFAMRGTQRVIIVDACQTGDPPGTLYKVPGDVLENLPPVTGLHMHAFRWDHALAFGRWLLKDEYPQEVIVYLVEVASLTYGEPLSPFVQGALEKLITILLQEIGEIPDVA